MKYPNHIVLDHSNIVVNNSMNSWIQSFGTKMLKEGSNLNNLNIYLRVRNTVKKPRNILHKYYHTTAVYVSRKPFSIKPQPQKKNSFNSNNLWTDFDINFLKKERMYTKLKYSRCPQYDIVSGGFAALLSGFIGFLICEKFGLELLDSGDFYYFFMYTVILCFSFRPLLKILSKEELRWSCFSPKPALTFYSTLINLFLKRVMLIINKTCYFWYTLPFNSFKVIKNNEYISVWYNSVKRVVIFLKNYPRENY